MVTQFSKVDLGALGIRLEDALNELEGPEECGDEGEDHVLAIGVSRCS